MSAASDGAIEAVIFDWGGTLADYATVELEEMWRETARHLAPHSQHDAEAISARLAAVELAFWERCATHQRAGSLSDILIDAVSALELQVEDVVLDAAAQRYLDSWTPHIRHDPEAKATLETLRSRGMRVGLLSNTHWPRSFHEHFLARDGLDGLIDARLYTSEMEYMKPHPSTFAAALDALSVRDPSRAVFVGDRPFDDIHGARNAGLRTVLRPNAHVPSHDVEPDAQIDSLPQLLDVIARFG